MHEAMATFPDLVWFVLALIAGAAVMGMLQTFAAQARNEVARHDLQLEVRRLQCEYTRRLQELAQPTAREVGSVDVLDDGAGDDPAAEAAVSAIAEAMEVGPEPAGRVDAAEAGEPNQAGPAAAAA